MCPRKNKDFYTEEELWEIKEQWLEDKKRIDQEMEGMYLRDIDVAYIKYLANKNLQVLFKHAIKLYWDGLVHPDYFLYKEEQEYVARAYREIKTNGYYNRSKKEEKRVRARLGIAVKRYTYRLFKKK